MNCVGADFLLTNRQWAISCNEPQYKSATSLSIHMSSYTNKKGIYNYVNKTVSKGIPKYSINYRIIKDAHDYKNYMKST